MLLTLRGSVAGMCLLAAGTGLFGQAKSRSKGQPDRVFGVRQGPGAKSKEEVAAVQAMLRAQAPDDQIRTADELITKFPKTDFKSFALYNEADGYEAKGDFVKAIVFCEQAVAADQKNFEAEILMANVIATQTKDGDLDKAEKLANATKFAKEALDVIATAPKPVLFQLTEDAWSQQKNAAAARAWQALGLVATVEKKPDETIADFEKGLALVPDPVLMVRTGRALEASKRFDEASAWFDKAIAAPDASAQIKDLAGKDKARVTAEKAK
jgi:tetratricopeptide (TPR) repeat protein